MDSEGAIVTLARDKIDARIAELEEGIGALCTKRDRLSQASPPPMDSAAVALARDKIDSEVAALKRHIRALRSERNHLAPIYRCPPEVVTQIFAWLQQRYLGDLYSNEYFPWDYRRWMRVTRVSQQWRQISLSSTSLWNVIPLRWLAYATESFNRLGSTPFFI
ncbi:hypothetical protein BDN72DRAFT_774912, partial [Pluteus cervinus]